MSQLDKGLDYHLLKSQVAWKGSLADVSSLEDLVSQHFKACDPVYGVFYLSDAVRFAVWKADHFIFQDADYGNGVNAIQLARVFAQTQELKVWRQEGALHARLRIDGSGEEIAAVDARQILWGTKSQALGEGWTRIFEDRGTELIIPVPVKLGGSPRDRAILRTRNYIGYLENGQASYMDSRFVALE